MLTTLVAGMLVWAAPSSAVQARWQGPIPGPDFCTNLSLGGPRTYAFDSNGDGIADTCSLPYTRREAVARQNALEAAFAEHPQFKTTLAFECAALGTLDFGDDPEDLAVDACNPPPDPSDFGEPLPTSSS
ncbi:hypothetical protein [Candidatus Poriferisocius sp.]|uniref:hypothetical protein n=1 Tax=Candidatus Poriferisocius sp. TaxID=3101276 RepID=UPI003B5C6D6E